MPFRNFIPSLLLAGLALANPALTTVQDHLLAFFGTLLFVQTVRLLKTLGLWR